MLQRGKGAPTLKEQLIRIIEEEIQQGIYKQGELLPREIDYEEKYGVSRITVRAAIGDLEQKGYVERIKGKGTIVLKQKQSEPLLKIEGFTDEMKAQGIIPTTKSAKISLVKADEVCARALQIDKGMPVYELIRIRCINDIPVVRFKTYIKCHIDLELDKDLYYGSLYDYLRTRHQVEISKITQRITAGLADEVLAEELNCNKKGPMLILKRIGYDQKGEVFEYTEGQYVASRYEYYMELNK
ncbi:GntR family transcriptional regulator [Niameybacter massiliensis]|uniref:GntR family transcriptional regulator n=1 Tax=Holtiella tumoricola TaxID=3018743 RepID=A0AA42DR23_9FIRM|nr:MULTISPECIES: GntR family transcriptional regulator [Lachnospirales]MDA3733318.1 GntR family transcriptional regulator [Holtiella tumoricola]